MLKAFEDEWEAGIWRSELIWYSEVRCGTTRGPMWYDERSDLVLGGGSSRPGTNRESKKNNLRALRAHDLLLALSCMFQALPRDAVLVPCANMHLGYPWLPLIMVHWGFFEVSSVLWRDLALLCSQVAPIPCSRPGWS